MAELEPLDAPGPESKLKVGLAKPGEVSVKQPPDAKSGIVPKVPFRMMYSGPSGSGKTNLARWMLDKHYSKNGKSFFSRIHMFSPTAKLDHIWKDLPGLKDADRHTELNPAVLHKIFEDNIKRVERMGRNRAPHELVIIDDAIADTKFMNSKDFLRLFIAGRHGNTSSEVLTQSYIKVPRSVRLQITALAMFPSLITEIERLYTEHGPPQMNKQQFIDMVQTATQTSKDDKHPFFFADIQAPLQDRFRRGLGQVFTIKTPGVERPEDRSKNDEPSSGQKRRREDPEEESETQEDSPAQRMRKRVKEPLAEDKE